MATKKSKFDPTKPKTLYVFLCDMPYNTLLNWKEGVPIYFKYANNREYLNGFNKGDLERKVLEVSISFYPKQSVTLYLGDTED